MKKKIINGAIGIAYSPNFTDAAPRISIKGDGAYAEQIVWLAKRYGVPIIERPDLVQILEEIELDEEISEDVFEAVALILAEFDAVSAGRVSREHISADHICAEHL